MPSMIDALETTWPVVVIWVNAETYWMVVGVTSEVSRPQERYLGWLMILSTAHTSCAEARGVLWRVCDGALQVEARAGAALERAGGAGRGAVRSSVPVICTPICTSWGLANK